MPFFDQPNPPAMPGRPPYEHDVVTNWTAQIEASDGLVFVVDRSSQGGPRMLMPMKTSATPRRVPEG